MGKLKLAWKGKGGGGNEQGYNLTGEQGCSDALYSGSFFYDSAIYIFLKVIIKVV